VTARTDARGQSVNYTYDALGRKTAQSHTGSTTPQATWTYDTAPGAGGGTTIGQLASSTRETAGLTYTTTVLGYDNAYQATGTRTTLPTSASLNALSGKTYDVGYTYTADGQIASTTLPKVARPDGALVMGKETVTTVYDEASMPHWQTGGFGWGTYVAESLFDPEGRPLAMDLGNTYGAVVTYAWEEGTGRLSTLALDRERVDGKEIQLSYRHDDAGNIQSVIDEPSNAAVIGNVDAQCYQYDQLRRLTTAWTPSEADCGTAPTSWSQIGGPAPGWTEYTYDAIGNRTSKTTRSASGTVVTTSTFGTSTTGSHRLLSQTTTGQAATTFTWDAAGNRTSRTQGTSTTTYTWDAEGELSTTTGGTATVNSVYDASGDRLVKIDGANATVYLPGGMEISSSSSTGLSATRWYTFAGQTIAHRTGNGLSGVTSIVADHQGSIIGTIHNTDWAAGVTRHRPDPFGGARGTSAVTSQGRGFLGEVHDSNSLVLLNARYFEPSTGLFISVDPVLDPLDPAHLNAYVYAKNNPVTMSDKSGLFATKYLPDGGGGKRQTGGSNGGGTSSGKSTNGGNSSAGGQGGSGTHYVPYAATVSTGCGYSYNPCGARPTPEQRAATVAIVQASLTVIGAVPGLEGADVISGLICLGQDDMVCAGLSFASAIPVGGWLATGTKSARVGEDVAEAFDALYRGATPGTAPSFAPRPSDFKVDPQTGFVRDTHGISVYDNPSGVLKNGRIPYRVDQSTIPNELRVIPRGKGPGHFEIVPRPGVNLTPDQYAACLSRIECG
jgi:RHS repeat-associated protein